MKAGSTDKSTDAEAASRQMQSQRSVPLQLRAGERGAKGSRVVRVARQRVNAFGNRAIAACNAPDLVPLRCRYLRQPSADETRWPPKINNFMFLAS